MKILVIIPAYNEEKSIVGVVENFLAATAAAQDGNSYDYLIVNDCSTDSTGQICREKEYSHISFPVNLGIGGGVQAGYLFAKINDYDIAVQMDGDGQHDPEYLAPLVAPIVAGAADMTVGSRYLGIGSFKSTGMRRAGINWLSFIILICCGKRIRDVTSGFRAAGRELIEYFSENYARDYPEPEAIVSAVLSGYRVLEIPVVMHERTGGQSSIRALKIVYYMVKVTLSIIIFRLSNRKKKKGKAK